MSLVALILGTMRASIAGNVISAALDNRKPMDGNATISNALNPRFMYLFVFSGMLTRPAGRRGPQI